MAKIVIALDAGHGLMTAGKRCLKSIDPAETREWILNDRIADIAENTLRTQYDCTVLRVDDTTGARDVALANRVKAANNVKAAVYLSIHHNAGIKGGSGGGTVVYHDSTGTVEKQAANLYNCIVEKTGLAGNRSYHVKKYGYYVLRHTQMPSFLIENGFMDSTVDTPIILTEDHAKKTAQGIVRFLELNFGIRRIQAAPAPAVKPAGGPGSEAYFPSYTGPRTTLAPAMDSLGLESSYKYRKTVAAANNIARYTGTADQNTLMYNLLSAGLLRRP